MGVRLCVRGNVSVCVGEMSLGLRECVSILSWRHYPGHEMVPKSSLKGCISGIKWIKKRGQLFACQGPQGDAHVFT